MGTTAEAGASEEIDGPAPEHAARTGVFATFLTGATISPTRARAAVDWALTQLP